MPSSTFAIILDIIVVVDPVVGVVVVGRDVPCAVLRDGLVIAPGGLDLVVARDLARLDLVDERAVLDRVEHLVHAPEVHVVPEAKTKTSGVTLSIRA